MSGERSSPVLVRWALGEALRELRESRRMAARDVARLLRWAPSKLSRIEHHEGGVSPGDVRELLDVYGVCDPEDVKPFVNMARAAQERGWWQQRQFGAAVPSWFTTFVGLEAGAVEERDYKGGLITGLLQTEGYARAILGSAPAGVALSDGHLELVIETRLERQQLLRERDDPLRLWAIMDEAVLRKQIGGPRVMCEQLTHLIAESERANITIQVLLDSEVHPALDFPFCVLAFSDQVPVEGLVYLESFYRSFYLEESADLAHYRATFDDLSRRALDPDASRALIHEHMKDLDV